MNKLAVATLAAALAAAPPAMAGWDRPEAPPQPLSVVPHDFVLEGAAADVTVEPGYGYGPGLPTEGYAVDDPRTAVAATGLTLGPWPVVGIGSYGDRPGY